MSTADAAPTASDQAATADPVAQSARAERLARAIVEELSERQAEEIALLHVGPHTDLADFFVICTANSRRQFGALEDSLRKVALDGHVVPFPRREGTSDGGWLLCDYGAVVVHVFDRETRGYYDLDGLWSRADTLLRVE